MILGPTIPRRAVLAGLAGGAVAAGIGPGSARGASPRFSVHDPASTRRVDHGSFDRFLARYRVEGPDGLARVHYGAVTPADRADLEGYVTTLEAVRVGGLNRDEQFSYWVNLYNARTLTLILAHYPVASIRAIKPEGALLALGPWRMKLLSVEGDALSLNDVEHEILRAQWRDARVHYALNCASIGCPNLAATAWRADGLSDALDQAARAFVNSPRGARLEGERLIVSRLYRWFSEDFGKSQSDVIAHLARYAAPPLASILAGRQAYDATDYDWSLNDAVR